MTVQIKATEQYFPVVLFITLCKVVLTFKSADEILKCDHPYFSRFPKLFQSNLCFHNSTENVSFSWKPVHKLNQDGSTVDFLRLMTVFVLQTHDAPSDHLLHLV